MRKCKNNDQGGKLAGGGTVACCAASAQRVTHGCDRAHRGARVVLVGVFPLRCLSRESELSLLSYSAAAGAGLVAVTADVVSCGAFKWGGGIRM